MGDLLSFLYTVVDTLSLIFFLDAFAQRRWDNWKFTLGIGCLVALNFWILQVPLVFFGRDPAVKIGMILLSYTLSARALYREISSGMLLLLVCIEYPHNLLFVFWAWYGRCFYLRNGRSVLSNKFSAYDKLWSYQLFGRAFSGIHISKAYAEKKELENPQQADGRKIRSLFFVSGNIFCDAGAFAVHDDW